MSKIFSIIFILALAGCGSDSGSSKPYSKSTPTPTPSPTPKTELWSEAEIASETETCFQFATMDSNLTAEEKEAARRSCRCVFDAASKKWSYSTFQDYPQHYIDQLVTDGTLSACADQS